MTSPFDEFDQASSTAVVSAFGEEALISPRVSSAYVEAEVELRLDDGRLVAAVAYVMDRAHVQYCQLSLEDQARIIARARGGRGPNDEYLFNTAAHLDELGIADEELSWLARRVRAISG